MVLSCQERVSGVWVDLGGRKRRPMYRNTLKKPPCSVRTDVCPYSLRVYCCHAGSLLSPLLAKMKLYVLIYAQKCKCLQSLLILGATQGDHPYESPLRTTMHKYTPFSVRDGAITEQSAYACRRLSCLPRSYLVFSPSSTDHPFTSSQPHSNWCHACKIISGQAKYTQATRPLPE